jgi:hypothetical protein
MALTLSPRLDKLHFCDPLRSSTGRKPSVNKNVKGPRIFDSSGTDLLSTVRPSMERSESKKVKETRKIGKK